MELTSFTMASNLRTPMLAVPIAAGAPRSVGSAPVDLIDLNLFIGGPNRLMVRVENGIEGSSMLNAGISPGDYLVLERTDDPPSGLIVIVRLNTEEYTCKRWTRRHNGLFLVPANEDCKPRQITEQDTCEVVGIVKFIVHSVC
jgi:DNA polymerase V